MTKRDVEIQRPLPKCLWQIPIMRIEKMIIQLKRHPQHRIRHLIIPLPYIEEALTKLPTEVQGGTTVEIRAFVILVLVQLDAEAPAAFPCFFVGGAGGGIGESALAVGGGEVGEGVAEGPAFVEGGFEGVDFVVWLWSWMREAVVGCVVVFDVFVGFGYV